MSTLSRWKILRLPADPSLRSDIRFYGLFSAASALIDATAKGLPYRLGKAIDDVILKDSGCQAVCMALPPIVSEVPFHRQKSSMRAA